MRAESIKREVARLKRANIRHRMRRNCARPWESAFPDNRWAVMLGHVRASFLIHSRCKIAVVNSELEDLVQRVILAHELAHGVLHVDSKIRTFHELSYLDDRDFMEREANIFAAEFLVDDTDLFDTLQSHTDFFSVASSLNVPPELLDFKLRLLEKRDGRFQAPYLAQSDFLRRGHQQAALLKAMDAGAEYKAYVAGFRPFQ